MNITDLSEINLFFEIEKENSNYWDYTFYAKTNHDYEYIQSMNDCDLIQLRNNCKKIIHLTDWLEELS